MPSSCPAPPIRTPIRTHTPPAPTQVTFGGGLVVAFINGWKMTLVVVACLPVMMASAVIHFKARSPGWGCAALWWPAPAVTFASPAACIHPAPLDVRSSLQVVVAATSEEDETFAQANQTASEAFTNIRTIAAFGMERQVRGRRAAASMRAAPC